MSRNKMLSPRTTQNFKLLELNKSHTNYPTLTFCPILKSTHSSSTNPSPNKQTPFNKFSKLAKSQTAPINYMHGSQKMGIKVRFWSTTNHPQPIPLVLMRLTTRVKMERTCPLSRLTESRSHITHLVFAKLTKTKSPSDS
jgi:hypothetical protein